MLTNGKQIAAARQLLGWSQTDLAARSGVSKPSVVRMEHDLNSVKYDIQESIRHAIEDNGVAFTHRGVQEKTHTITNYEGAKGFRDFMWDVYNTSSEKGGDICLFNARPEYWHKWLGVEWYNEHAARMLGIRDKITFRAISNKNNPLFIASSFGEYRWFPDNIANDKSFYAYGNKLGLLNFENDTVNIVTIQNKDFADTYRVLFDIAWVNAIITNDPTTTKEDERRNA